MSDPYEILQSPNRVTGELKTLLEGVEVATIGHLALYGVMHGRIRPVFPVKALGNAVTVVAPGRDGAVIYKAIDTLKPGDMLVISRVDGDDIACVGGGVAAAAKGRGAAGIVLDGPCADAAEIVEAGLPVWCAGASAKTTNRAFRIGGTVNVPIACGGVAVLPGYVVLADADGVFAADADRMAGMARAALERQSRSAGLREHLLAGKSIFDFDRAG
ncbi:RraA family protein [Chelativorans xinjiangense]|uniref:RraA family protein n=1 Tax=Chelativorans xinjiangense TaxID=2681485 RepID=UPI00135885FE|nr:RraA family protein [Chelativorans xinjiangense]